MQLNPGQIQMKSGKWFIVTCLKGYRKQKVQLDEKLVESFLMKYKDGAVTGYVNSFIDLWIKMLKESNGEKGIYKQISESIKRICVDSCKFNEGLLEVADWLSYLSMNIITGKQ